MKLILNKVAKHGYRQYNGSLCQGRNFESRGANFKSRGRIYATRSAILGPQVLDFLTMLAPGAGPAK